MEDQCVSLALAQRLKALGVKQESEFAWHCHKLRESDIPDSWSLWPCSENDVFMEDYCAAFTVAELGEILPDQSYSIHTSHGWNAWDDEWCGMMPSAATEAEARGSLLAALLEREVRT